MEPWAHDLLHRITAARSTCKVDIHRCLEDAANYLKFEYYSFGFQQALPVSQPRISWVSSYPQAWEQRYGDAGYITADPRIDKARVSPEPFVWTAEMFAHTKEMWQDLRKHGMSCGVTQSIMDGPGGFSMLSFSRSSPGITSEELREKREELIRLSQITHRMMSRIIQEETASRLPSLTNREIEVLRWTADGKSAQDIADILSLSKNTIDFHIKNSVTKMGAPNKTAAVTRAALLGLLY